MNTFERLLAKARKNPITADFTALRLAYVESPGFNPYSNSANTPAEIRNALALQDPACMAAAIERVLDQDYLDIEAHIVALHVLYQQGKFTQAIFHDLFAQGLLASIMQVDGRTPETAFRVISIREEYAVMSALGLQPQGQRKVSAQGKNYDILTARHPQTGEELDFYFNIDLMRSFFKFTPPNTE
jgi:hypothetical protein